MSNDDSRSRSGGRELLLLSGGLDSTVLAYARAAENGGGSIRGLFFDGGRPARTSERGATNRIANDLGLAIERVDVGALDEPFRGLLDAAFLSAIDEIINKGERVPLAMVALGRFATLLQLSAFYAQAIEADRVAMAFIADDVATVPSLRPYLSRLTDTLQVLQPTLPTLAFDVPFAELSRADVVRTGLDLGVPFEWTWSCTGGGFVHCGRCRCCALRRAGFEEAGVADPTAYAA